MYTCKFNVLIYRSVTKISMTFKTKTNFINELKDAVAVTVYFYKSAMN